MATKLKKGMSVVKAWLVISESGQSSIEEIGKHSIMKRTGLPARDLRALDPLLSYPSSILGREGAIVVSLEHIRAIITAKEVFLINYNNPLVVQFVQDLQHRIVFGNNNITSPHQAMDHSGREMEDAAEVTWGSPSLNIHHSSEKNLSKRRAPTCNFVNMKSQEIEGEGSTINVSVAAGPKALPFEFKVLEACLESACRCLESETRTLEEEAYPALDELTSKISTLNLERVRQIKSRLVALSGRVQKVRDELENLLDDDNDMAEMYLTEKVADAPAVDQISIIEEVNDGESEADDESVYDPRAGDYSEINTNVDIEELEMLLEAYFAQIDGILQKLSG
uniref:Magnesium transporter n=1 Tax=Salix viminalis TaxID=40686 RepID=A0A6N2NKR5_SALVM